MSDPNQFNTYRSFFTNDAIIRAVGGNVEAYLHDEAKENQGEEPEIICKYCNESVLDYEFINEMDMCRDCYQEEYGEPFVYPEQVEEDR